MSLEKTSDSTFQSEVLNHHGPVLVDFWAEWCGPCKAITPILEDLAEALDGKIKIVKLNVDENPDTPGLYGIRSIPTLMIFKNGEVVQTQVGGLSRSMLEEWINKAL